MADQVIRVILTGNSTGLQAAARDGDRSLSTLQDRSKALTTELGSMVRGGAVAFIGGSLVGAAGAAARAIYEASAAAERLNIGLRFASGGNAGRDLDYLKGLTRDLGLEMRSTAASYTSFAAAARGTSLEGEGARRVFTAVSSAAAVMGLSSDQASGALLALQQMVSKGTVSAEELRGQLGERLPGAFQIAARAMGVTTAELGKMLEQGEVIAADFLPRFAEQLRTELGDSMDEAANRMDAATARMGNAWQQLLANLGNAGVSQAGRWLVDGLATDIQVVNERMELARATGKEWFLQLNEGLVAVIGRVLGLGAISDEFRTMGQQMTSATDRIRELNIEFDNLRAKGQAPGLYQLAEMAKAQQELAAATAKSQQLRGDTGDLGGSDIRAGRAAGDVVKAEEARAKRVKDLAALTNTLTGANAEYIRSLKLIQDSAAAGEISEAKRLEMLKELAVKYGPAAKKPTGGARGQRSTPTDFLGQMEEGFAKRVADYELRNEEALDRVEEKEAQQLQRREERAADFAARLLDEEQQLNVNLIDDDQARADAQLELERQRMLRELDLLEVYGEQRAQAEEAIERNIGARRAAIAKELAEASRSELSRVWDAAAEDIFVKLGTGGKVDWKGVFTSLAESSMRDSWRSLKKEGGGTTAGAIDKAFEKLTGISGGLADQFKDVSSGMKAFESGLGGVVDAIWRVITTASASSSSGGGGGFFSSLFNLFGSSTSTTAQPLTDMGASTVGMSLAVGTNRIPADGWKYLHRDEAVVPAKFNPWAGGTGLGGGVTINSPITFHGSGNSAQDQVAFARMLDQRDAMLTARITQQLARPGSAAYNAARR